MAVWLLESLTSYVADHLASSSRVAVELAIDDVARANRDACQSAIKSTANRAKRGVLKHLDRPIASSSRSLRPYGESVLTLEFI